MSHILGPDGKWYPQEEWEAAQKVLEGPSNPLQPPAASTIRLANKLTKQTLIERLGKEDRDGVSFDLTSHLQASVARGSELARKQLFIVDNFDHGEASLFDQEVKKTLQLWEEQFRELYSEFEIDSEDSDLDDFILTDEFQELTSELTESWAEFFDLEVGISIYPETSVYVFESLLKSKVGIGPFGSQGSGESGSDHYQISHYAENLVLSPFIPRTLLWDISIGEFANDMTFFQARGDYLDTLPSYLVGICASPTTSLNLLKAINEVELDSQVPGFCEYVKTWVQFPLLVNPVTDIWLLAKLEPANIANSFFNSFFEKQDMTTRVEDKGDLEGGVLGVGYNWDFVSESTFQIFKLSQEFAFDEDLFAAALLGQRIIEEFKCERVRIEDHLDSESGIVRAVAFCNPNLESSAKQGIDQGDPFFENQKFLDLITSLWSRNDLSVVV